jgi:hypothetical protein
VLELVLETASCNHRIPLRASGFQESMGKKTYAIINNNKELKITNAGLERCHRFYNF